MGAMKHKGGPPPVAGSMSTSRQSEQAGQAVQPPNSEAYLLHSGEGEQLVHFRDLGQIIIKIGTVTGSEKLTLATQQVKKGAGIPMHRHLHADEAFYVLAGDGVCTLSEKQHSFKADSTIFIPGNCWHSFSNPSSELLLLWIMSPGGLDTFFRETCSPPGEPQKQLTTAQIKEIARRHGTEFR